MLDLGRLFDPATIAVVGGRQAELAVEQCDRLGYAGEIWPVHPGRDTIAGRKAYRSVAELPAAPDAAFVAVNRLETVEVVNALAKLGAGGAVCYAAGFAESGPDGADLQRRLVDHDMPVVGPNCYGVINAVTGAALWPDVQGCRRVERGAALITQSGNIALNLTMNRRGLQLAHVISLGNQAGVRIEDCLAHLAEDPAVTAIGIHAESIIDPPAFGRAALVAHETRTPIVMLKTARSAASAAIATSHTAAIAKPDDVYSALFDRYGVITVSGVPELAAVLDFFTRIGPLDGRRAVSLSCSGGEASLVADRAAVHGVDFPRFEPSSVSRLAATLGEAVAVTNPLDYHTFIWGNEPALTASFTAALSGDTTDVAMLVLDWPAPGADDGSWWPTLRAMQAAAAATGTPAVVTSSLPENMPDHVRQVLNDSGLVAGYSVDETLAAIARAAEAGEWFDSAAPVEPHLACESHDGPTTVLAEWEAKVLLDESGVPTPRRVVASNATDTAGLHRPLVAKATGVAHKSDVGGVITGIVDDTTLTAAFDALLRLGDRVLVEEQVADVVCELLVTVRREPPIGIVLVVGAGGQLVELMRSTATVLLPVDRATIVDLLDGLAVGALLRGARGRPSANIDAVAEVVLAICDLVAANPAIIELEVNPLLATVHGAVAVDALITIEEAHR